MKPNIYRLRANTLNRDQETLTVHLNAKDSRVVAEALVNPPKPNKNLRKAARRHGELFARPVYPSPKR